MTVEGEVARHYTQSELTRTVLDALRSAGKNTDALTPADLAGVDEFHTGWGPQTVALAQTLELTPQLKVLDVGSGIGGPARHFASAYGCDVTGIDLTPAFVELANELTFRTGLAGRERDWTAFVVEGFAKMRARIEKEGMPVVGLHLLLGPSARESLGRVVACIEAGLLAPTEIVAVAV